MKRCFLKVLVVLLLIMSGVEYQVSGEGEELPGMREVNVPELLVG